MRNYKNIKAWQHGDDLTVVVYTHTRRFPREEVYGLTSQLRRASYSVPANIAEGSARNSKKDYLHFLYVARGSLAETEYFCHLAHRLGYLEDAAHKALEDQVKLTFNTLRGLITAVEKEAGALRKATAIVTSAFAILLMKAVGSAC